MNSSVLGYCPICGYKTFCSILVRESKLDTAITHGVFSARRLPDRVTSEWIECNNCGLAIANPTITFDIDSLYKLSKFSYIYLTKNLRKSYVKIMKKSLPLQNLKSVLEIGGGNGFMLEAALKLGFNLVHEVEPSLDAFNSASDVIRSNFSQNMFDDSFDLAMTFDLVMNFHVLDHVRDPVKFLSKCSKLLNFNGYILIAVHNHKSFSAKIMKDKSPIYDIEHTFLYSKKTLSLILKKSGFRNVEVKTYWNWVTLSYLIHLLPIPHFLKEIFISSKFKLIFDRISLYLPLGNFYAVAQI